MDRIQYCPGGRLADGELHHMWSNGHGGRANEKGIESGVSGTVVSQTPLTREERSELEVLERVVIDGDLGGNLFPLYIRSFQQHTGVEPTGAVKRLATQIEALVRKRRVFTPAMMAIVIREYLREST